MFLDVPKTSPLFIGEMCGKGYIPRECLFMSVYSKSESQFIEHILENAGLARWINIGTLQENQRIKDDIRNV